MIWEKVEEDGVSDSTCSLGHDSYIGEVLKKRSVQTDPTFHQVGVAPLVDVQVALVAPCRPRLRRLHGRRRSLGPCGRLRALGSRLLVSDENHGADTNGEGDEYDGNDWGSKIGPCMLRDTIAMCSGGELHSRIGYFHGFGLRLHDRDNLCEFAEHCPVHDLRHVSALEGILCVCFQG